MNFENRYIRQAEIVSKQNTSIAIVGVGAVGRQVALQLAAMGMTPLTLIDFDTVDDINLSAQGFRERDLGSLKTDAVRAACIETNSQIDVLTINDIYRPKHVSADVVFSCSDSIEVRKKMFTAEAKKGICQLLLDSRMSTELCRVIRCNMKDPVSVAKYKKTFFKKDEAYQERCTTRTTIYCANITAGLLVAELTRWMRGFHVADECELNILGLSFAASRP